MKVLIVGGLAGGPSTAARLRRLSEDVQITIFEKGENISYASCGLPYYIGDKITEQEELILNTPEGFKEKYNIDVHIFSEVIAIDRENKKITIKNLETNQEYQESYDKLVLAPGGSTVDLPIPGKELNNVFQLKDIDDTIKIKNKLNSQKNPHIGILGGGFISLELVENFVEAGAKVSLIEKMPQVMSNLDLELTTIINKKLQENNVDLYLNSTLEKIEQKGEKLKLQLDYKQSIEVDFMVMAPGVEPNSQFAQAAGIAVDEKKAILTNQHMQTSDQDIYAIGDVVTVKHIVTNDNTYPLLAGPANKQGRIVADHIFGLKNASYNGALNSSILKLFDLTIASTGINEKTAKIKNINYDKIYTMPFNHASYYPGCLPIFMKIIFEKGSAKILGGQVFGESGVDKVCDNLACAITMGATAKDLKELELCYAPPYGSAKSALNMAGYTIENIENGLLKQVFWTDIPQLLKEKENVTLLDVRPPEMYAGNHIKAFKNIPLGKLRESLTEIPKDKPVYVICHSGITAYNACRLLQNKGFDCYNISGAMQFYTVFND